MISFCVIVFIPALGLNAHVKAQSIGGNIDEDEDYSRSSSIISNSIVDDKDGPEISISAGYSIKSEGEKDFFGTLDIADEKRILKSAYIATIDIGRVIPGLSKATQGWFEGEGFTVGVKRPFYRIGGDMRLRGFIDFRLSHPLMKVNSSLVVSVRYDFRKYGSENSIRSEIVVADIAYKIIIPFFFP